MNGSTANLIYSDVFSAPGAAQRGPTGQTLVTVAPSPTVASDDMPTGPPVGLIALDSEQRIILFDQGAADMFGYSAAEARGQSYERLLAHRHRDYLVPPVGTTGCGAHPSQLSAGTHRLTGLRSNGNEFPLAIKAMNVTSGLDPCIVALLRDRTDVDRVGPRHAHASRERTKAAHRGAVDRFQRGRLRPITSDPPAASASALALAVRLARGISDQDLQPIERHEAGVAGSGSIGE